jgi:hypothetical protein
MITRSLKTNYIQVVLAVPGVGSEVPVLPVESMQK